MPQYNYNVAGTASGGQTWSLTGIADTDKHGDFAYLPTQIMRDAFMALTDGKAEFGTPGIGCAGPYRITKLTIEEKRDAKV